MTKPTPLLDDAFARLQMAASVAATSPHNDRRDPTERQALAGNYKKAPYRWSGLTLMLENVRNSVRTGTSEDGKTWANRLDAHYGEVAGTKGADGDPIDVFMGLFPESTAVWVINQGWPDGGFDEHKLMLGFATEQQARDAYLGSYDRGWTGLQSMVPCSIAQLLWWLKHGNKSRPFSADQLPFDGSPAMNKTLWTPEAEPVGVPMHKLMYDLRTQDREGLLLDAASLADIYADPDIESVPLLDALVVEVARMTQKMNLLQKVMEASAGTIKPSGYTVSDPIKARGVMQVAVLFAMSDGQTITVWFHNPDTTPTKLMPLDELISWKWMLNKKDITIVVAPERGRDLNVREVARRIMRLVERNAPAFAKANEKLTARIAEEKAIDDEIVTLTGQLTSLETQIEVAKQRKVDATARAIREALADINSLSEKIEIARPAAMAGDAVALTSLEILMNEVDDKADALRALRGDEAKGRSSWATWEALRAAEAARAAPSEPEPQPQADPEPTREAWRVEADAFGEGKAGYVGTRDLDNAAGIVTEALGSWAFTRMGDSFQAIFPTGEGTYTGGNAHATPDAAYESMIKTGRWVMIQSEIAAAVREGGDPADKLAPGSFVDPTPAATEPEPAAAAPATVPAEPTAPAVTGDISYRADDMFTTFLPDTAAGEDAWRVINATEGSEGGKVLNQHAASVIEQLRAAGYTVTEAAPVTMTPVEEDALVAELAAPVVDQPAADAPTPATKADAAAALGTLRRFVGRSQLRAIDAGARGEEKQHFYDKIVEMARVIDTMPATYGQDGKGDASIAYLHYFSGGSDWYITEKDMEREQLQAFGMVSLNGDTPEIGYVSIEELISNNVELDLYWTPKTLARIKGVEEPAAEPAAEPVAEPAAVEPTAAEPTNEPEPTVEPITEPAVAAASFDDLMQRYAAAKLISYRITQGGEHEAQVATKYAIDDETSLFSRNVEHSGEAGAIELLAMNVEDAEKAARERTEAAAAAADAPAPQEPSTPENTPAAGDPEDVAFLNSLVDGSADYFADDLYDRLAPLFAKYEGNQPMLDLFNLAAKTYGDAVVLAAQKALA